MRQAGCENELHSCPWIATKARYFPFSYTQACGEASKTEWKPRTSTRASGCMCSCV